ncbi:MAG: hypothetical protein ACI87N_003338 [Flavobacteriales bacterium]|jgi:hypothetical protein
MSTFWNYLTSDHFYLKLKETIPLVVQGLKSINLFFLLN